MTDMRQFVATPTVEELEAEVERLQREWKEDLKAMTLQWEIWEESDKAKDAEVERLTEQRDGVVALYNASVKRVEQLQAVVDAAKQELRDVGSGPGWVAYRILKEADDD